METEIFEDKQKTRQGKRKPIPQDKNIGKREEMQEGGHGKNDRKKGSLETENRARGIH